MSCKACHPIFFLNRLFQTLFGLFFFFFFLFWSFYIGVASIRTFATWSRHLGSLFAGACLPLPFARIYGRLQIEPLELVQKNKTTKDFWLLECPGSLHCFHVSGLFVFCSNLHILKAVRKALGQAPGPMKIFLCEKPFM